MKSAIRVKNVSKLYHIGSLKHGPQTLKAALAENLAEPWRRWQKRKRRPEANGKNGENGENGEAEADTIWALRDISFEVRPGEVIGIVGANGSGKSTLMKILSRVTIPTAGQVEVRGRVGSLLEVGTGFDPEFTGRENIYLSGPILGMSRREIDAKFQQIVEFAEVDKFLDTPVKHFSSGMQLRLGFAVAAHLDPDILLVDEALAVGDAAFQNKCLERLAALAKSGRTVLFVSHDTNLIANLCSRALILHKGRMQLEGPTESVIKEYLISLMGSEQANVPPDGATAASAAAEEQLSDLLETPPEEAPIAPLAHEVASTLLTYLPDVLAEELVHRLSAPLAGYVSEYLASSFPHSFGLSLERTEVEPSQPDEPDPEAELLVEGLTIQIVPPPDLEPAVVPEEETAFQLRNWDHPLSGYPEYVLEASRAHKDVNDWIQNYLGWGNSRLICHHTLYPLLSTATRVCELGAGTGRWARHVAPRLSKGEYHLLENDPWLVKFLRSYLQGLPHVQVHFLDGYTCPFREPGGFDLAVALDVFFGYPLGKIDLYVRELARILRPGGRCVIQYVDAGAPLIWDFLRNYGTRPTVYADAFVYHPRELIERVFEAAGFTVERRIDLHEIYRGYPFTTLVAVRNEAVPDNGRVTVAN